MKRHAIAAVAGLVVALVGAGNAAAGGLPVVGGLQDATQTIQLGDQTVGEQRNDSKVEQSQGNGNVNVSPAVAIFGDASTTNSQGNDNTASADVDQSNEATQAQRVEQEQRATGHGCCRDHCRRTHGCGDKRDSHKQARCCDGRNATNEQRVRGGDQTVGAQRNDSKVEQSQGNGNVNVSPAVAIFGGKDGHGCKPTCHGKKGGHGHRTGEASTRNAQGNGNDASARIGQSNEVEQRQDVSQSSALVGACKKAIGR